MVAVGLPTPPKRTTAGLPHRVPSAIAGGFVLRMRCYASGWVSLALPVWAGLFKGLSGSHETFAYTGRASATQT